MSKQTTPVRGDYIEREGVTVQFEYITPERAAKAIAEIQREHGKKGAPKKQRPLHVARSEYLQNEMMVGHWHFNGATIIYDTDGFLVDGQGRFSSIAATGNGQWCLVVYNVSKEAVATIDTGQGRTLSDYLYMEGHVYTSIMQAAIYMEYAYQNGKTPEHKSLRPYPSIQTLLDYSKELRGAYQVAAIYAQKHYVIAREAGLGMMPSLLAWVHFRAHQINPIWRDKFLNALVLGEGLANNPTLAQLSLYLRKAARPQSRITRTERAAAIVAAWNALMLGYEQRRYDNILDMGFPRWIESADGPVYKVRGEKLIEG